MAGEFKKKVALVTGGGSGIGKAAALAFAHEGARIVVCDVDVAGGEETTRQIDHAGSDATFVNADVTRGAEAEAMVEVALKVYGRLDYALNSAGVEGARSPVADYPEDEWIRVIRINLTGVFLSMKYEIPAMLRQGGGAIVNMASVAGVTGFPKYAGYTASKHGVVGLTKTAALEYAGNHIRINALCPAYTHTPMVRRVFESQPDLEEKFRQRVPVGRMAQPEEVAGAVLYLCSDRASFITGHPLVMDGGIMAA